MLLARNNPGGAAGTAGLSLVLVKDGKHDGGKVAGEPGYGERVEKFVEAEMSCAEVRFLDAINYRAGNVENPAGDDQQRSWRAC